MLPRVANTCYVCGSHDFKRLPDDNAETVRTRMAEYRAKTAPILPIYDARGIVAHIDGMAPIDEVNDPIETILGRSGLLRFEPNRRALPLSSISTPHPAGRRHAGRSSPGVNRTQTRGARPP